MKKYMKPVIEVVKIHTASMIATSDTVGVGDGKKDPTGADARFDDWDED